MTTAKIADVPVYLDGVGTARALNMVTVTPAGRRQARQGLSSPKGWMSRRATCSPRSIPPSFRRSTTRRSPRRRRTRPSSPMPKLDLERYQRLAPSNAVNKQQVDTQRALVDQLRRRSGPTRRRSTMSSAIARLHQHRRADLRPHRHPPRRRGQYRAPVRRHRLVVITQVRPIAVLFNLPQQELPELSAGMGEGPAAGRRSRRRGQGDARQAARCW